MTGNRRAVLAVGLAMAALTAAAVPASAAEVAARVQTFERFDLVEGPGGGLVLNFGYAPASITVPSGSTVKWANRSLINDDHTVTVVSAANVPDTIDEVFNCEPCNAALAAHDPDGNAEPPFVDLVNVGKVGLNRQGDSRLLLHDTQVFARVTAAAGRTLHYVCAIHPWMRAEIHVT